MSVLQSRITGISDEGGGREAGAEGSNQAAAPLLQPPPPPPPSDDVRPPPGSVGYAVFSVCKYFCAELHDCLGGFHKAESISESSEKGLEF